MNNRNIPLLSRAAATEPAQETSELVTHRLSPEAYRALEQTLSNTSVSSSTTDGQAFYKLGIEHALKTLREGFVVGA